MMTSEKRDHIINISSAEAPTRPTDLRAPTGSVWEVAISYFVSCGIPAPIAALGWTECLLGVAAALCLVVVGYTLLKLFAT